jgi:hypothetical protein
MSHAAETLGAADFAGGGSSDSAALQRWHLEAPIGLKVLQESQTRPMSIQLRSVLAPEMGVNLRKVPTFFFR